MGLKQLWYAQDFDTVLDQLGVDGQQGLSSKEAGERLHRFGPNKLKEQPGPSPVEIFLSQFKDFMVIVLIGATLISAMLGEYADAITILAIVFLNAILGFVQEFRAEKSMEALKKLTAPEATVVRSGREERVSADQLVPGDIILLETGDKIPADLRLGSTINLEIEESTLTGESVPVKKNQKTLPENTGLGDRRNMAYLGTVVTRGRGSGVVVATGMQTEMGSIAGMIQEVEKEQTPLQKRLQQLGRWLVLLCLGICAVVVVTGVMRGEPLYRMFLTGVSLAVAAIPEGLPAIVTISLAVGVQKMIRRQAIIRKLQAVETLGCATVICSDKTGTLTQNEMTVRQLFTDGHLISVSGEGYDPKGEFTYLLNQSQVPHKDLELLLKVCALCNNAGLRKKTMPVTGLLRGKKDSGWNIVGDPTEAALLVVAAKGGYWRENIEKEEQRVDEIPFDSDRKRMSVVYRDKNGYYCTYTKGAPDVILNLCQHTVLDGKIVPLTPKMKDEILKQNDAMAREALRVLAMAYKKLPQSPDHYREDEIEQGLVFIGLAGMIDPPRQSAIKAIEVCKQAGIKTVMITGDHQTTAFAIARELKIVNSPDQVLTGVELDQMTDSRLEQGINDISVYARVSPKHKLRIVKALKKAGHVVAMTGDGVNDAPAVKEADIGVSMGITGTDVTKEASAMVLADDNFATIVAAVEEGRGIYDNIRKFIRYLLSCNIGEVLTMFLAALMGLPLPLLPIQILWVNLVTDGLPAMALGVDNADPDIMERRPRHPKESIFSRGLWKKILFRGTMIGVGTILVFCIGLLMSDSRELARTMAFSTLVFSQLFHVFDCKSERYSIFETGIFSNIYLVFAVMISTVMQLSVIYLPFFQSVFKTVPLEGIHWAIILSVAGGMTVLNGLYRAVAVKVRRKILYLRA